MPVYVDDMKAGFGNMVMCHMLADTTAELIAMADTIGVQRKWIQCAGTPKEHFDICKSKRKIAVRCGAREVSYRYMAFLIERKRNEKPKENGQSQPGCQA